MKRRLLDIIACPNDKHFPLELTVDAEKESTGTLVPCDLHCSRFSQEVESGSIDKSTCAACSTLEILEGRLFCPRCKTDFRIAGGIACLLADRSVGEHTVGRDKANEMQARDAQVDKYDDLKMLKVLSRLEIPRMVRLLDAGRDDLVVELGAGTGRVTKVVAGQAGELVAIDFSLASLMRSRAKSACANVYWVQGDVNRLPLRDGVGDRAFSCQVFEHLPGTAMRNIAVDEAFRVIKSKGTFAISVYRDSWLWRAFGSKEGYHRGGIYYYRLSGVEFQDLLRRRFTIEKFISNLGLYLQAAKCIKN